MTYIRKLIKDPRIFLFIMPLILFSPIYLTGKALFWGTASTQFVPWWEFAWKSILSGQFPFWNPLLGMGAPLAANYQTALFYPITWIYFLAYLFGGVKWMAWSISLVVCGHLIWSGMGTAKLLRELNANKFGQTLGGLAFSLSGYLVARAGFLSINAAAAWMPWLLLCLYRLAEGRPGNQIRLTAVLSMLFLAGHAQTAWHAILMGGFWLIFWAFNLGKNNQKLTNLGRSLAGFLWAGVLAIGISAIQLLPTAEYLMNSQRAVEYGFATAMTYSFWPWRFLTLILPDLFGNPATGTYWGYANYWEDAIYIGLVPILLALGLLIRSIPIRRQKKTPVKVPLYARLNLFLGLLVLISFTLALGDNTPVFPFLYDKVPGLDLFQAPTRYSIIAVLSLALLAGIGASRLDKPVGKSLYFTRLAVAGCIAVIAGSVLAGMFLEGIEPSFLISAGRAGLIGLAGAILYLAKPERYSAKKIQSWRFLLLVLVSLDLVSAGYGLNPAVDQRFYELTQNEEIQGRIWMPRDVEYDLKFNKFFKFETFLPEAEWTAMHQVYLPNLPMLQGAAMVNNFDPILPGYYQEWMESINAEYPAPQFLEMMNVSKVVEYGEGAGVELISLEHSIAPVKIAGCAGVETPAALDPGMILKSQENLLENLLVTADGQIPCISGGKGRVSIIEAKNGYLRLDLEIGQDSWLFWSQTWYPGWQYKVDGEKGSQTFRVNYLFQGVPVPGGANEVELIYRPASVIWGSLITGFGLVLFGVLITLRRRTKGP